MPDPLNPFSTTGYTQSRAGDPYRPISIYDAPSVLAEQLLSGNASWRAFHDTLLDPDSLAPDERRTIADRIAGTHEGLSKAMIEVASNPWVWASILMGPVGAKALQAGKSLFAIGPEVASITKRSSSWFAKNMLTDIEAIPESATFALETSRNKSMLHERAVSTMAPHVRPLLDQFDSMLGRPGNWHSETPFDPDVYSKGTDEYGIVKNFNFAAWARSHGFDTNQLQKIQEAVPTLQYKRPGAEWAEMTVSPEEMQGDAGITLRARDRSSDLMTQESQRLWARWGGMSARERSDWITRARLAGHDDSPFEYFKQENQTLYRTVWDTASHTNTVPAVFDGAKVSALLDSYGEAGRNYLAAASKVRKQDFISKIGDEKLYTETGNFAVDPVKAHWLASDLSRALSNSTGNLSDIIKGSTSLQGKEALLSLLGEARFGKALAIEDNKERVKFLTDAFTALIDGGVDREKWNTAGAWLPRNSYEPIHVPINGEMRPPPKHLDALQRENLDWAPFSASQAMSDHVIPITDREVHLHPQGLEGFEDYLTEYGRESIMRTQKFANREYAQGKGRMLMGLTPNYDLSHARYTHNMHSDIALNAMPVSEDALMSDAASIPHIDPSVANRRTWMGVIGDVPVNADLTKLRPENRAKITPGILFDRLFARSLDPVRQDRIRNSLIPGALNNAGPEHLAVYNAQIRSKELASWFSQSMIGKAIRNFGPQGAKFMDRVAELGDFSNKLKPADLSGGLARWFYTTHLGLNLSSSILNLMQPLMLAGTVGSYGDVLAAYKDSFLEMSTYARKRMSLGRVFITPAQKQSIMQESFEGMGRGTGGRNITGIGPDPHSVLDSHLIGLQQEGILAKAEDLMLKGFEKSEWFNRNTAYHIIRRSYLRSGRNPLTDPHFVNDAERFILQTQYGQHDLNTPGIFQKGLLANPLARQFFTFPLRSATGALAVFPRLGAEPSYLMGLARTTLRGMGMSAALYEAGKGLFGADLHRGLFASGVTDLFGGQRLLEKQGDVIQLPPVVAVPLDMIRGVASGDMQLLAGAIARTIPGGVALNRAIGISPQFPDIAGGFPSDLQSTYVDWAHPNPEGQVPVFKRDGSLIEYRSPSEITLKALGADLGEWGQQGQLDNYLVKQRDQIIDYRHRYLRALGAQDYSAADSISREFQSRYKVPLTVTQEQVKDYLNNRVTGRTERVLDRIPADVRMPFQQMAGASGTSGALTQGGITAAPSSRRRDPYRNAPVTPEQVAEIQRRQSAVGGGASQDTSSFTGFSSF